MEQKLVFPYYDLTYKMDRLWLIYTQIQRKRSTCLQSNVALKISFARPHWCLSSLMSNLSVNEQRARLCVNNNSYYSNSKYIAQVVCFTFTFIVWKTDNFIFYFPVIRVLNCMQERVNDSIFHFWLTRTTGFIRGCRFC